MAFTAILTPVEISFIPDDNEAFKQMNNVLYVLFGADIIINFLSASYSPSYGLETTFKGIAKRYMKSWFIIDLVSV